MSGHWLHSVLGSSSSSSSAGVVPPAEEEPAGEGGAGGGAADTDESPQVTLTPVHYQLWLHGRTDTRTDLWLQSLTLARPRVWMDSGDLENWLQGLWYAHQLVLLFDFLRDAPEGRLVVARCATVAFRCESWESDFLPLELCGICVHLAAVVSHGLLRGAALETDEALAPRLRGALQGLLWCTERAQAFVAEWQEAPADLQRSLHELLQSVGVLARAWIQWGYACTASDAMVTSKRRLDCVNQALRRLDDLSDAQRLRFGLQGDPESTWLARLRRDRDRLEARLREVLGRAGTAVSPEAIEAAVQTTDERPALRLTEARTQHQRPTLPAPGGVPGAQCVVGLAFL